MRNECDWPFKHYKHVRQKSGFTYVTIFQKLQIKLPTCNEEMMKPQWKTDSKFHISLLPTATKYKKKTWMFSWSWHCCAPVCFCALMGCRHTYACTCTYNSVSICVYGYSQLIFSQIMMLHYPQRINIWKQMSDESYGIGYVPYVPHFSTPVDGLHFLFSA